MRPFEGNLEADVAPGENEFDTPNHSGHSSPDPLASDWFGCKYVIQFWPMRLGRISTGGRDVVLGKSFLSIKKRQ